VISAYVYLRIVLAMYDPEAEGGPALRVPLGARVALVASVLATVGFGLWPQPINQAAKTAVSVTTIEPIEAPAPPAPAADDPAATVGG
jgi:NADH:ubiquinone oxidoreductase subunit 2 (subunit N)